MIKIKYGITGNYYAISDLRNELEELCVIINKSSNSIYYNSKYKVYCIRCKSKLHKNLLRNIRI